MDKLNKIIKEALQGRKLNESQQLHDFYRGFGLNPDNIPSKTAGILSGLRPGRYFVDYSGKLYNGPYMLKYIGKERSLNLFDKINLETGKTEEKEFIVQRGNLGKLRPTFLNNWKFNPDKLNESQSCKIPSLLNENLKHTHFISEQFRSLIDSKKPLIQEIKRINDVNLVREARILFDKGILNLPPKCQEYMNTSDFGKYKLKEGKIILEGLERDESNKLKPGDKGYGDLEFANKASQIYIDFLQKYTPIIAHEKWSSSKVLQNRLEYPQIEAIKDAIWSQKGNMNQNKLKQYIRGLILRILKNPTITKIR